MKLIFVLTLLAAATLAVLADDKRPSNFNLAIDYSTIETLKYSFVKPLVEKKLKNLPINGSFTDKNGLLTVTFSNVIILDVNIDWDKSRLLTIGDKSNSTILLKDVAAYIQFDFEATFGIKPKGKENKMNITLDVMIALGFEGTIENLFFTKIVSHDVPCKSISVKWNSSIGWILKGYEKLFGKSLRNTITDIIKKKIDEANVALINATSKPIVFNQTAPIDFHMSLANIPQIVFFMIHNSKRTVQTFNWNIQAWKNNQKHNTSAVPEVIPSYIDNFAPVQLILNDEIFEIAIWTVFEKNLINFTLSDAQTNSSQPLYTNALTILFPDLVDLYGDKKGAYVRITKGGDYPMAQLTDGRLAVKAALNIDFWVDKDSSNYPTEGFDNCHSCVQAVGLNTTIFVTATIYQMDHQHIGLKVINMRLADVQTTKGNYDGNAIKNVLNKLLLTIVKDINTDNKAGIPIPEALRKLGVNSTDVMIESDNLVIGLDFQSAAEFRKNAIEY